MLGLARTEKAERTPSNGSDVKGSLQKARPFSPKGRNTLPATHVAFPFNIQRFEASKSRSMRCIRPPLLEGHPKKAPQKGVYAPLSREVTASL